MSQKRSKYRNTKVKKAKPKGRANERIASAKVRQMQLIRHGVVFVLFLCIAVFGFMIVKGFYGDKESVTNENTDKEVKETNNEANNETNNETSNQMTEEAGEKANQDDEAVAESTEVSDVALVEDIKITISAVGDCTLGSDEDLEISKNFDTMYANVGGPSYFVRNVREIFEQDDLTIVNLEGPLTTSTDKQEKAFAFKGKPEYADILKEGSVEAANIANNHSYDYGQQGFDDTVINLNSAGIAPFGYDATVVKDIKGAKVGLIGIYVLNDEMGRATQLKEKIAEVKAQGAALTIVSFHWGIEKDNYPNQVQKDLGRMAIDEGADLVLGHHPHVLQGIEKYKGKNIVYSLGNFCFGGNSNPSDYDTMIFQQTFTIRGDNVVEDDDTNIIPCFISSENWYNNYQPIPAQGSEKERIEAKIKEFSEGIGTSDE